MAITTLTKYQKKFKDNNLLKEKQYVSSAPLFLFSPTVRKRAFPFLPGLEQKVTGKTPDLH